MHADFGRILITFLLAHSFVASVFLQNRNGAIGGRSRQIENGKEERKKASMMENACLMHITIFVVAAESVMLFE